MAGGAEPLLLRIRVRIVTGSRTILSIAYYSTHNKWMTHLWMRCRGWFFTIFDTIDFNILDLK